MITLTLSDLYILREYEEKYCVRVWLHKSPTVFYTTGRVWNRSVVEGIKDDAVVFKGEYIEIYSNPVIWKDFNSIPTESDFAEFVLSHL